MNYDALTLAAVCAALREALLGGRVQRVVRPSTLSLGLEIYRSERRYLYLSAEPREPTALLSQEKPRRGVETTSPLQLLLRKYVEGALIEDVAQPPLERMLRLDFAGAHGRVTLVCELMGRLSNLILLWQDGVILNAAKRVPRAINRYRTVLPGQEYVPPPGQDKLLPVALTPEELTREVALAEGPLWRRLVETVAGISPLLAREIIYRATGELDPPLPLEGKAMSRMVEHTQELWRLPETARWQPSVAYQGQGETRYAVAYAPYALTHLRDYEVYESIHQALRRYLAERERRDAATPLHDAYALARRRVQQQVDAARERQEARLAALRRALVSEQELATLQLKANAILAMAWTMAPGQRDLRVSPFAITGDPADEGRPPIEITLDPALSPVENAQAVFQEYRKRQAAAAQVPALIQQVQRDLDYLRQLEAEVALAEDRPQLDEIEAALAASGLAPARQARRRERPKASEPLRLCAEDGTWILVGRNGAQNEEVTFRRARPTDLWLHAHGVPGAHVVIRCAEGPPAEATLRRAAELAAYYSASRHEPRVQVDVTLRRHVRSIRGGRPGMVTYREESTLIVTPRGPGQKAEGT